MPEFFNRGHLVVSVYAALKFLIKEFENDGVSLGNDRVNWNKVCLMDKDNIKFSVVVTGGPYGTQSASSAYQFCAAAISAGHQIAGVFFYQDGVLNASQLVSPPSDEINLPKLWAALAGEFRFPLEVCVSAALRRGIVNEQEATQLRLAQFNLQAPFVLSGLGQLAELSANCDRLVQF
jgi:tRNA 2-thiouridine synthesizing protein D